MILFVFFALPLATILLAIVLQKILKSPILVAITFFAIFLIIAFAAFSDVLAEALIATIIYTIIAFITAVIVKLLKRCFRMKSNFTDNILSIIQGNNNSNFSNNLSPIIQGNNNLNFSTRSRAGEDRSSCYCGNNNENCDEDNDNATRNNLLRISCSCGNSSQSNDLLTVNSTCFANDNNNGNTETINAENELTGFSGATTSVPNQIRNTATVLGNNIVNRNNMPRRCYRRW